MEDENENDMFEIFGIKPMNQLCVHAEKIYFYLKTTGGKKNYNFLSFFGLHFIHFSKQKNQD